ncbi:PhoH family protein [Stomatohabitans albus]|uniref:PhoH family protein n=1 Tax=Stomatohabitans albus TaxID=3110766 RepID=UPI00300C998E
MSTTTSTIIAPSDQVLVGLLGPSDRHLGVIERAFTAGIHLRGNQFTITGEEDTVNRVTRVFTELIELLEGGKAVDLHTVEQVITMINDDADADPSEVLGDEAFTFQGRTIRPKTFGQKQYLDAIRQHIITFGIGPAGTGKTYLAMAMAVNALRKKEIKRIILTRPAVEAGESLGFLPGTLTEKIDPYLRPLFDALHDMMEPEFLREAMELGIIEVAPLAYMRGRTLNDAFVVLDEAQNTTPEQMKMFLTRIGERTKVVVTGDDTQVDLPGNKTSALRIIETILGGIEGIAFIHLTGKDVVRHKIVQAIVNAYDRADKQRAKRQHKDSADAPPR